MGWNIEVRYRMNGEWSSWVEAYEPDTFPTEEDAARTCACLEHLVDATEAQYRVVQE